jgi:hypothetical protein
MIERWGRLASNTIERRGLLGFLAEVDDLGVEEFRGEGAG